MRAAKLLTTILHQGTPDTEFDNALTALRTMYDRNPNVQAMFGAAPPAALAPSRSFNEQRRHESELEAKLTALQSRANELERRLHLATTERDALVAENQSLKHLIKDKGSRPDGTMPFTEYVHKVQRIFGMTRGWRMEWSKQTGLDQRMLTRAGANGFAPKELVSLLPRLKPVVAHSDKGGFSFDEVKRIRALAHTFDDEGIASKASDDLSRIITPGMIRKLRVNLKNGNGAYSAPEFGGPLPVWKKTGSSKPAFDWSKKPQAELATCQLFLRGGVSIEECARFMSEKVGFEVSVSQTEKRLLDDLPPKKLISGVKAGGPLTWEEMWLIGKTLSSGRWLRHALNYLGIAPEEEGVSASARGQARTATIGTDLSFLDPALVAKFRGEFAKWRFYDDFERIARDALHMSTGWQTAYEKQTGTSHTSVQNWRARGLVPVEAVEACSKLVRAEKTKTEPWTSEQEERVKQLHSNRESYRNIAKRLTNEFGREFTENMVSGRIRDLKARGYRPTRSNP